ncbi:MAG: hypothetical protein H6979_09710 [Chromatiales bacterium]|nr:hypothetical protein [Chromatiales bacterium]
MFKGEVLDIRTPNSEGWALDLSTPGGWSFVRHGARATESYVASVLAFNLTETTSNEDFVALIKESIEKDTSPDRFTVSDASYDYTDARGYPCVKYQATAEDKKAHISIFKREPQKLQIYSLYCRHPIRPSLGFAITFSHRGPDLDPDIEKQAQDFISGVDVPPHTAAPMSDEKKDDT